MGQTVLEPESVSREAAEEIFCGLAQDEAASFRAFFVRIREIFPHEVARGCLNYLASCGAGPVAESILGWIVPNGKYFRPLLDPAFLPKEKRDLLAAFFRGRDSNFFANFGQLTTPRDSKDGEADSGENRLLYSALQLLETIEGPGTLRTWLLGLTHHRDPRVRSKATKLICKLQSTPELIQRQFRSTDARVRANAVEALWGLQTAEAANIFKQACSDSNHRVVVNGLIGLYFFEGDGDTALRYLQELAEDSSELLRAAAMWAFGYLKDQRAIPVLEKLVADPLDGGYHGTFPAL